jgi:hypothetical protein
LSKKEKKKLLSLARPLILALFKFVKKRKKSGGAFLTRSAALFFKPLYFAFSHSLKSNWTNNRPQGLTVFGRW